MPRQLRILAHLFWCGFLVVAMVLAHLIAHHEFSWPVVVLLAGAMVLVGGGATSAWVVIDGLFRVRRYASEHSREQQFLNEIAHGIAITSMETGDLPGPGQLRPLRTKPSLLAA